MGREVVLIMLFGAGVDFPGTCYEALLGEMLLGWEAAQNFPWLLEMLRPAQTLRQWV